MLHTINHEIFSNTFLQSVAENDVVLLLENAVYAASSNSSYAKQFQPLINRKKLYVLMPDVSARGLQDKLLQGVTTIDYRGFVDLVCEHEQVCPWH